MSQLHNSSSFAPGPNSEIELEPDFGSSIQTAKTGYFSDYFPKRTISDAVVSNESTISYTPPSINLVSSSSLVSASANDRPRGPISFTVPLNTSVEATAESSPARSSPASPAFVELEEMPPEHPESSEQSASEANISIDLIEILSDDEDPDELEILSVDPPPKKLKRLKPSLKTTPLSKKASPTGPASATASSSSGAGCTPKSTRKPALKLAAAKPALASKPNNQNMPHPPNTGAASKPISGLSGGPGSQKKPLVTASRPSLTPVLRSTATQVKVNEHVRLTGDIDEQRLLGLLSQTFGHDAFRSDEQRNATYALLNGLHLLIVTCFGGFFIA